MYWNGWWAYSSLTPSFHLSQPQEKYVAQLAGPARLSLKVKQIYNCQYRSCQILAMTVCNYQGKTNEHFTYMAVLWETGDFDINLKYWIVCWSRILCGTKWDLYELVSRVRKSPSGAASLVHPVTLFRHGCFAAEWTPKVPFLRQ